jgi:hypothetical protein
MNHNKFTPTYNQVNEQGDQPTILIPRRDGTIQTATLVKVEDGSGYAAEFIQDGHPMYKAIRKPEAFSDQVQAGLAGELAHSAGRSPEQWVRDPGDTRAIGAEAVHALRLELGIGSSTTPEYKERERDPRQWLLAEPFDMPDDKEGSFNPKVLPAPDQFRDLFEDLDEGRVYSVEDAAIRPDRSRVAVSSTAETEGAARDMIYDFVLDNPEAVTIFAGSTDMTERGSFGHVMLTDAQLESLRQTIRSDQEVRYKLLQYFAKKISELTGLLPDQSVRNLGKIPAHAGYERFKGFGLKSREYSALLALAMLDGTFNEGDAQHDPIYDPLKNKNGGQHRYTAQLLIGELPSLQKEIIKRAVVSY